MDTLFLYLLKATFCLLIFTIAYHWLFSRFTHFQWMRSYLIASVSLSIVLPLLQIPAFFSFIPVSSSSGDFDAAFLIAQNAAPSSETAIQNQPINLLHIGRYLLLSVYLLGFLYKLGAITKNLLRIRQLIQPHYKVKEGNHYLIYFPQNLPAFSFWHYIFLNPGFQQLSAVEQQQIKQHELVHVRQKHTLDLLFFEIAGALFWFNPLMVYLKNALREVHEYLADAGVTKKREAQKSYAYLLLKLATNPKLVPLANGISGKQIGRRITMLTKARSLPVQRFTFLLIFPLAAVLLLLNACMDEPQMAAHENGTQNQTSALVDGKKIRKIIWEGNSVYDDAVLDRAFGLKPGDTYNQEILNKHLNYNPAGKDLSSLFMDNGYLFFSVEVDEKQVGKNEVNLVFNIFEGERAKIDDIIIKGNQTVSDYEIRAKIPIESGDIFSRAKLFEAQKAIAAMGYFDPQQVGINPMPEYSEQRGDELGKIDIEFIVVEVNPK